MELKDIAHLPAWAKTLAIAILSSGIVGGAWLAIYSVTSSKADFFSPALTLIQFSLYGLAAGVVILFAERELTVARLVKRLDSFYSKELLTGLQKLRFAVPGDPDGKLIHVAKINVDGSPRGYYVLTHENSALLMYVSLNVRQLLVVYFFPVKGPKELDEEGISELRRAFHVTIDGAEKIGWDVAPTLDRETFDDRQYFALICRVKTADNFLLNGPERLYWITDIAIMSGSALQRGRAAALLDLTPSAAHLKPARRPT